MSDRPQDILYRVLLDDMGVCQDRDVCLEIPCLQEAWRGVLDYELEEEWWWWFVDTFVDDPEENARIHRAADEVRRVFLDIAKLHHATTGEPTELPERLIRVLQMRVISAMRPTLYQIGINAKTHPAARASASLKRLTKEKEWLVRS